MRVHRGLLPLESVQSILRIRPKIRIFDVSLLSARIAQSLETFVAKFEFKFTDGTLAKHVQGLSTCLASSFPLSFASLKPSMLTKYLHLHPNNSCRLKTINVSRSAQI